jgi:hypothetical protein
MAFFVLTPEDAGRAEPQPGSGTPLYLFDTWLGDDLVRAHPLFLATTPLKESLEALPSPRGFHSSQVRVEPSPFLEGQRPRLRLPEFWALEVYGEPGIEALGLSAARSLVVSLAALLRLAEHRILHAHFAQFNLDEGALLHQNARSRKRAEGGR